MSDHFTPYVFASSFKMQVFDKPCSLRTNDSLVQNCLDDQLHPRSSGLQAHFSAVCQRSSATEKKGREKVYLVNSKAISLFSRNIILGVHLHVLL